MSRSKTPPPPIHKPKAPGTYSMQINHSFDDEKQLDEWLRNNAIADRVIAKKIWTVTMIRCRVTLIDKVKKGF